MRNWLKWIVAGPEMAELERRRVAAQQYRRWLAEFRDVALVLDNLEAEACGEQLCMSHPPRSAGPWTIGGLRDVLRRRAAR